MVIDQGQKQHECQLLPRTDITLTGRGVQLHSACGPPKPMLNQPEMKCADPARLRLMHKIHQTLQGGIVITSLGGECQTVIQLVL